MSLSAKTLLRNIEKSLYEIVRHADEIGDDIVVDPWFRIPWPWRSPTTACPSRRTTHDLQRERPRVLVQFRRAVRGGCAQAPPAHPRREPAGELRQKDCWRTSSATSFPCAWAATTIRSRPGYRPWLGNLYGGLTMDLFKLIGNDNLLTWVYDNPGLLHAIMNVIRDDRAGALQVHGEGRASLPEHGHLDALPGQLRVRV